MLDIENESSTVSLLIDFDYRSATAEIQGPHTVLIIPDVRKASHRSVTAVAGLSQSVSLSDLDVGSTSSNMNASLSANNSGDGMNAAISNALASYSYTQQIHRLFETVLKHCFLHLQLTPQVGHHLRLTPVQHRPMHPCEACLTTTTTRLLETP